MCRQRQQRFRPAAVPVAAAERVQGEPKRRMVPRYDDDERRHAAGRLPRPAQPRAEDHVQDRTLPGKVTGAYTSPTETCRVASSETEENFVQMWASLYLAYRVRESVSVRHGRSGRWEDMSGELNTDAWLYAGGFSSDLSAGARFSLISRNASQMST